MKEIINKPSSDEKLKIAKQIAETADVSSPENSVVLFSVSYQPTNANKRAAFEYIATHKGCYTLGETECGKKLIELGLEVDYDNPDKRLMDIWAEASKRFIESACGNITAFVDNADPRSTFVSVELPLLLENKCVFQINGMDKFEFAKRFA
ncbi:MAG: hypothetical protein J5895_00880 [Alphaproteobacteria bacterium]|nr:hypothetical protein [Alphaproteobacteria bacterium]